MARGQAHRRVDLLAGLSTVEAADLVALPASAGIYCFFDGQDRLLYIGKSVNLRARVRSYFRQDGGHTRRTARLKHEAARIGVLPLGGELEALLVESRLIKQYLPPYNVLGRAYEHYPFLKLTREEFPRLELTRRLVEDGASYFGPFASSAMIREVIETLSGLFGLRSCNTLPHRPCLTHSLGRCLGPCRGEAPGYAEAVRHVERVLQGQAEGVLAALWREMLEASDRQDFERAARARDRHGLLSRLVINQSRLRDASVGLDLLVEVPDRLCDGVQLLAIRRARWVGQWRGERARLGRAATRRSLERFLRETFVERPAPDPRVEPEELDEVQIVGSWLYRRRHLGGLHAVDADNLPATLGQLTAALAPSREPAPKSRPRARLDVAGS